MPQHDLYHDQVKHALIKAGWIITHDPFTIEFKSVRLFADTEIISDQQIKLLIFNPETEEIVQWIN